MYWELVGPHRFKFNAIINFCGTHFYKSDTTSERYKNLRAKHIRKLIKLVVCIFLLIWMSYSLYIAFPMYESVFKHKRVTPIGVNLPFLEKDSNTEFMINSNLQTVLGFYSSVGGLVNEVSSCTINHAIMLVPEMIRFNLLNFQDEFNENGMNVKSRALLRNAFIQLQDYNRFERHSFAVSI